MRAEERIARLELARERAKSAGLQAELAAGRAEKAALHQQTEQILARLREVEGRLGKDSHYNSKLPSSDGQARKTASQRKPSGKKSGGQPGHAGQTLKLVEQPDLVIKHRPSQCAYCQQSLEGIAG